MVPPPSMKNVDPDDMQSVLAAQTSPPPPPPPPPPAPSPVLLLPPQETTPIARIRAPNRQEIFRILPPGTAKAQRPCRSAAVARVANNGAVHGERKPAYGKGMPHVGGRHRP